MEQIWRTPLAPPSRYSKQEIGANRHHSVVLQWFFNYNPDYRWLQYNLNESSKLLIVESQSPVDFHCNHHKSRKKLSGIHQYLVWRSAEPPSIGGTLTCSSKPFTRGFTYRRSVLEIAQLRLEKWWSSINVNSDCWLVVVYIHIYYIYIVVYIYIYYVYIIIYIYDTPTMCIWCVYIYIHWYTKPTHSLPAWLKNQRIVTKQLYCRYPEVYSFNLAW